MYVESSCISHNLQFISSFLFSVAVCAWYVIAGLLLDIGTLSWIVPKICSSISLDKTNYNQQPFELAVMKRYEQFISFMIQQMWIEVGLSYITHTMYLPTALKPNSNHFIDRKSVVNSKIMGAR